MQSPIATVLPFLAARLGVTIADLLPMLTTTVTGLFGRHAILFLRELTQDKSRTESMTDAEIKAWPAIKETAAMVGINAV